jgi:RNA processing factor Prp31
MKMIKMLASKTALASRVDVCKTHPSGDQGLIMREGIISRY